MNTKYINRKLNKKVSKQKSYLKCKSPETFDSAIWDQTDIICKLVPQW